MRSEEAAAFAELVEVPCRPSVKRMTGNKLIERIKAAVGADYLCIGQFSQDSGQSAAQSCVLSDKPLEYLDAYFSYSLAESDPLMMLASISNCTVDDELAFSTHAPSQRLVDLKEKFGIGNRTLTPVFQGREKVGFLTAAKAKKFNSAEIAFLEWVSKLVYETFVSPPCEDGKERCAKLTPSEISCLTLASKGLSSEQIARASNFSFETVNSYLKDATKKIGAHNRLEAVVIAIRSGLI